MVFFYATHFFELQPRKLNLLLTTYTTMFEISFKIAFIFNGIRVKSSHRQTFFLVRHHILFSISSLDHSFSFLILFIGQPNNAPSNPPIYKSSFLNYTATVLFKKRRIWMEQVDKNKTHMVFWIVLKHLIGYCICKYDVLDIYLRLINFINEKHAFDLIFMFVCF